MVIILHCIVLCCIVLCCVVLYCIVLYCIVLYCIVLHCIALHCIALHCIARHGTARHGTALHCTALHCTALHCTALHCTALHCTALHCTLFVDMCKLPKVTGRCYAYMPRWYFNSDNHKCEKFIYGGCEGNMNNFQSKEECQAWCSCPNLKCNKVCEYGRAFDHNGCPTCECLGHPCAVGINTDVSVPCYKVYV